MVNRIYYELCGHVLPTRKETEQKIKRKDKITC